MASDTSTARCPGCAAIVLPGAAWCGLCLRPIPTTAPASGVFAAADAPFDAANGAFRPTAPKPAADLFSESRWRSGVMTFGPVGRVVLTIGVFLPYPFFLLNLPFGLVGVVVWTAIVPRALRDIWQRDRRHHVPPLG
jgi:hypothetical protein